MAKIASVKGLRFCETEYFVFDYRFIFVTVVTKHLARPKYTFVRLEDTVPVRAV